MLPARDLICELMVGFISRLLMVDDCVVTTLAVTGRFDIPDFFIRNLISVCLVSVKI